MHTYSIRGARTKATGHIRRTGTRTLYCGRPAGAPNDYAQQLTGFKMCTPCVKAADEQAQQPATALAARADTTPRHVNHPDVRAALATLTNIDLPAENPRCLWHGDTCDGNPHTPHQYEATPAMVAAARAYNARLAATQQSPHYPPEHPDMNRTYWHTIEATDNAEDPTWYILVRAETNEEYNGTPTEYGREILANYWDDNGEETPQLTDDHGNAYYRVVVRDATDTQTLATVDATPTSQPEPTATERFAADMLAVVRAHEQELNKRRPAPSIETRLNDAGRIRRAFRNLDLPTTIRDALTAGMRPADIARRAECNESYVRRIRDEHRPAQ